MVPNTSGWELGVANLMQSASIPVWYCSETPYARVLPESIDHAGRSFTMFTYIYEIGARHRQRPGAGWTTSQYPADPRAAKLSFGYLQAVCRAW